MADRPDDPARPVDPRTRFGPSLLGLLPVLVLLLGALPLAAASRWLAALLIVPVVCAVWVVRARVVADAGGLRVCNGLGVQRLRWEEIQGLDVQPRRPVRLLLRGDGRGRSALVLSALSRRDVPALLAVARTAGRRADLTG